MHKEIVCFLLGLIRVLCFHHSFTLSAVSGGTTSLLFLLFQIANCKPLVHSKLAFLWDAQIIFLGQDFKIQETT
jgi:hypothetical protein